MMMGGPAALRAHFTRHNRRALLFALVTALGALVCWWLLYLASYWLLLLALTAVVPMETQMPRSFERMFLLVAVALCALAGFLRWLAPNEYPRDRKSPFEIALEIILMVPRMTLAAWGNVQALVRLNATERALAWRVLEVIARAERLPVRSVPLEIAEEKTRARILLALQITDLIETREIKEETYLVLKAGHAALLGEAAEQLQIPPHEVR